MNYKKQRILLFAGLFIAIAMITIKSGIIDIIFWFMLAGVLPGTDYVVSPMAMLIIYFILGSLIITWAVRKDLYIGSPTVKKAHREANKKAAKVYDRKILAEDRKHARGSAKITSRRERYTG